MCHIILLISLLQIVGKLQQITGSLSALSVHKICAAIELKRNPVQPHQPEFHLSLYNIQQISKTNSTSRSDAVQDLVSDLRSHHNCHECGKSKKIIFPVDHDTIARHTLQDSTTDPPKTASSEKLLIEFSSPNIAKPFHFGHMRSTIIGNFIAKLYAALGHDVVRINYIGDWGTQFGMLKVGMDMRPPVSEADMQSDPIQHLYEAYVHANRLSETDEMIGQRARQIFCNMEQNDSATDMANWQRYRRYTVDELVAVYRRLGVEFDEYSWESQYRRHDIRPCIDAMYAAKIIETEADGRAVIRLANGRCVPVLKSDGTTLYVTRDVAALLDREQRYLFDRMLYVVENGQHNHFEALTSIARQMRIRSADLVEHVKFGRVHGMSTRRGTVVFLKDILDEAAAIMLQKQIDSPSKLCYGAVEMVSFGPQIYYWLLIFSN